MEFENKEVHDPNTPPSPGELDTEAPLTMRKPKYKECLKNHAVGIGSHAVDGCGEFMPAGEEGTVESFTCAACNCHRNFHRKHIVEITTTYPLLTHHPYNHFPPPPYHHQQQLTPLALPSSSEQNDMSNSGKKRFRTKFSQEQKMKMQELAEKLGWRIQGQDDSIVQQFCEEYGVKRNVFKVWMHNNKQTLGKNLTLEPSNFKEAAEEEN